MERNRRNNGNIQDSTVWTYGDQHQMEQIQEPTNYEDSTEKTLQTSNYYNNKHIKSELSGRLQTRRNLHSNNQQLVRKST
jgi:hypothetical protein